MIDSRQLRRRTVNFLVNKYVDGVPHICQAVNLSMAGMLLHKIGEPALVPGPVDLEFLLPDLDLVVRLPGQVLAESPTARAHAVRFTHVTSEVQKLLQQVLSEDPRFVELRVESA